jgi:hypothetical protein
MRNGALDWLIKVGLATALLAGLALLAGSGRAMAADAGAAGQSALHWLGLLILAWLLSSLRLRRKNGRVALGIELSPVRRVRVLSSVVRARNARSVHLDRPDGI